MRHSSANHQAMGTRLRTGFTLVELLVVIAIIGVLVGLLLPAVQSARESARRAQCLNSLKNLTLAMQQFDESRGNLPGYVNALSNPNGPADEFRRASWVVMILPNLEYQALYDKWSRELPNGSPVNPDYVASQWSAIPNLEAGTVPQIELLECASDEPDGPGSPWLSYVVNAGQAVQDSTRSDDLEYIGNGVFFDNCQKVRSVGAPADRRGSQRLATSIDYVQQNDGLSKTWMMSENIQTIFWAHEGLDASTVVDEKHLFGFIWHNETSDEPNKRQINGSSLEPPLSSMATFSDASSGGEEWRGYPSSNHPGGVNVGYCDGHVVFVNESVEKRVYGQLMTSNYKRSTLQDNGVADRKLKQPSDADL